MWSRHADPCAALRRVAVLLAVLAGLLHGRGAGAADDPYRDWRTLETTHLRVHYPRRLERVAERVAQLGEAIHDRLVGPLGHVPHEVTHIAVTDETDSANGSATSLPYNTVRLFVTAPEDMSPLNDHDDWMLALLTHEYTHILHTDNVSGVPSVVNTVLGKTLSPNQIQPRWIIEGLAVVAETEFTSGGRIRSSLFDMYLRADVIEDNIARLDHISSNPRRWPQATLWYLYGSRFLDWVAQTYGMGVLRAVSVDYGASVVPWGINRAIQRATGRTYPELYEGFLDHLRRQYAAQMAEVRHRGLREGSRVTFHGRSVSYPSFVPDNAKRFSDAYELAYFRDDFHHRSGIYSLPLGSGRRGGPPNEETFLVRSNSSGPVGWAPNGDMLFSSVVPYRQIYRRSDVFSLDRGTTAPLGIEGNRRRLTVGRRASAPTVSPDGRYLAYSVTQRGQRWLDVVERRADGSLGARRTLVRGAAFDQAYTPVFSPDSRHLAYSAWTAGGFRDIRIVDVQTGAQRGVTFDRALDQQPVWSPDGARLYFVSDRGGIANVHVYRLADGALRQVTNVRTGAYMPAVSADEKLLAYVGYTSAGYDLFVMPLDASRYLAALPPPTDRPDPLPEPPPVPMKKRDYRPIETLRPYNYFLEVQPGTFSDNTVTITTEGSDIARRHTFAASVLADPGAPLPQLTLDYDFGGLPVDMNVQLSNRVNPRTDFRLSDNRPGYLEKSYNVRTGASYNLPWELGFQRFSLSYTASVLSAELPIASAGPFDPYAEIGNNPDGGLLATARLGYAFSNVESSFDAAGPARGFALNLGFDVADERIGSQETLYSATFTARAYFPMPWPGHHTLAVRSSGGISGGSFSRRGLFFVGGYNLDNFDLIDTLTSSALAGSFVLRGYEPSELSGRRYVLNNFEYRFPIAFPDRGISTLPLFLRRIDGNLFLDHGGAFDDFDFDDVELFHKGSLVYSPQLYTGAGFELWLGTTLGYVVDFDFRLGYAFGFSEVAIDGGQLYFVASSAF